MVINRSFFFDVIEESLNLKTDLSFKQDDPKLSRRQRKALAMNRRKVYFKTLCCIIHPSLEMTSQEEDILAEDIRSFLRHEPLHSSLIPTTGNCALNIMSLVVIVLIM
jgi:hypothetical protein